MNSRLWTWGKWVSLGISVGSIILAVALMEFGDHGVHLLRVPGQNGSGTRVDKPLIVERKGDRLLWRLKADKAEQELSGRLLLTKPVLEMFTANGEIVTVSGERAQFDSLHRNIDFHSQVKVTYRQWQLRTNSLVYVSSKDEVSVPGSFVATGDKMIAKGKGLRANRDTQQLWVDHGVHIEDRGSHWAGGRP